MKIKEREKAEKLRRQGWSYNQISKEVNVSKGTLSIWLSDISLTEEQQTELKARCRMASIESGRLNRDRWNKLKKELKDSYVPPVNDAFFMLGLGLYWGEGDKNKSGSVGMANADYDVLCIFKKWAQTYLDITSFSICIQHYQKNEDDNVKKWWSEKLCVPIDCFYKSTFSISKSSTRKRRSLKYGTAQMRAKGKEIWRARCKIEKTIEMMRLQ